MVIGVICRTTDKELIKSIVTLPDLWATVAEDGQEPCTWEPDMGIAWLVAQDDDGQVMGLYSLIPNNCVTLEIHPYILPLYRGKKAYQSGREVLAWIGLTTSYSKVVCQIPVIYKNVKLFAMRCGFKQEGINRLSYLKNGKIVDQWRLGVVLNEIQQT